MSRLRRHLPSIFGLYAGVLFMMTHWPKVALPVHNRSDLLVHASVFGLWCAMLVACGVFGAPLSRSNVLKSGVIAIVYALMDEALQAIPFLRRVAAIDDAAANVTGVLVVMFVCLIVGRFRVVREAFA